MAGRLREVVLGEVFRRLPDFVDEERARLDGSADGPARGATIALDGAQFLKLVTGHLNPVTGVLRRQLKVHGEVKAPPTFGGLMDIPGPRGS